MRQFIEGADWAWDELKIKVNCHCIRFKNQEMPPGCIPNHAHVGFENDPQSQAVVLLVQHGVQYSGINAELRDWFRTGERRFASFEQLKAWIQGPLKEAFEVQSSPGVAPTAHPHEAGPATEVTGRTAVQEGNRDVPASLPGRP